MVKSSLCDYSDAYILVNGTVTIAGAGNDDDARESNERNKWVTQWNLSIAGMLLIADKMFSPKCEYFC